MDQGKHGKERPRGHEVSLHRTAPVGVNKAGKDVPVD
jgi:hypothetical protein